MKDKITPEDIEAVIAKEDYIQPMDTTTTFCILTLVNGFAVTGESACVSPANFDEKTGREIAKREAVDKVWGLEGYLLKQRMYEAE